MNASPCGAAASPRAAGKYIPYQSGKSCSSRGFTLSLEAAASLLLLLSAASALQLYSFPRQQASDYYLCSDAAIILSKTPGSLLERVLGELSQESGLCLQARLDGELLPSGCQQEGKEKFTLSLPAWKSGKASQLSLSCSRP